MNSWVNICSMELRWTERCRGALRTRVHASSHARWSADTPWVDVKTIAGVVAHIQRERRRGQTPTPDAVCALSSEASLPVRGNKHLSCANSSVKCTNCGGEADVSAGVTALGLEAMSEPGISCSAPPTPNASTPPFSPSWTPALAEGHSGNYYLLDVCLISSHSSRWPSQGHGGMCWPPPSLLVSSPVRVHSGKIISDQHLDHLFRGHGVSREPNCPHSCVRMFRSCLSLQVDHEWEPWKVQQAECQRGIFTN